MNKSKEFDKYFQYSYFDEINEKVGVFSEDTPNRVIKEAEEIFNVIEFD